LAKESQDNLQFDQRSNIVAAKHIFRQLLLYKCQRFCVIGAIQ